MARTAGPAENRNNVFASLVITQAMNDEIQREAEERGMNRSALIRHVMRQWLKEQRSHELMSA